MEGRLRDIYIYRLTLVIIVRAMLANTELQRGLTSHISDMQESPDTNGC